MVRALRNPWIFPQIHEEQVHSICHSMSNNCCRQVSPARQVHGAKQQSIPDIFQYSGGSLTYMGTSENDGDYYETYGPSLPCESKESRQAIHQVAPINQFFAKRGQYPDKQHVEDSSLQMAVNSTEGRKIRHFAYPSGQQWLADKQFECLDEYPGEHTDQ